MIRLSAALSLLAALPALHAGQIPPLDPVASWGYLLDNVDPQEVAASGFDLVVIDYSQDGSGGRAFDRSDLAAMQRKPDGGRRLVLAYLSIGEAETYRYYWKDAWKREKPAWLDDENPDWAGNIKVRYWDPEWQDIIYGSHDAYLDRIMGAGFDGVYLDLIDAFEHYGPVRRTARAEMADFVAGLSRYAKGKRGPGFLVVGQNGESLASEPRYLAAVDGIAKEDLYFSWETDGVPADPAETAESLAHLKKAKSAGKKILVVEYVSHQGGVAETYSRAKKEGFVPYASRRNLDRLVVNEGHDPPTSAPYAGEGDDAGAWLDPGSSRFTNALLFSTTIPFGTTKFTAFSEHYTENYQFYTEDLCGNGRDFITDDFFEWTSGLEVRHALSQHFEVGVRLPIVHSEIDAPAVRGQHRGYHRSETGLGNIGLLAAFGIEFGPHQSDIFLVEAQLGLPTDTRSDDFSGGGHAVATATYEHYWDNFGVTARFGVDLYADDGYSGGDWTPFYLAGPSYQWGDRLYTSALIGQRDFDIVQLDLHASYLLGTRSSIELSWGKDLTGEADASYISLSLNYIMGGERTERRSAIQK